MPRIIMFPNNHIFVTTMQNRLERIGVHVSLIPSFHYATPYNFLKILYLRIKGYKIIHVHWLYFFSSFILYFFIFYCKMLGIKIVWEIHNVMPHKKFFYNDLKIRKTFFKNADIKVVHYQNNLQELKDKIGVDTSNVRIIPHGNFIGLYPNIISKKIARYELNLDPNKNTILTFGFIQKYKGYNILIDAIEKYKMTDINIIVAGTIIDKKVYNYLKKKEDDLDNLSVFGGFIEDNDVQLFMNAADVVVLPYEDITTSGVVLLAYSFKKPVITTNIGGMRDIVIDEYTGFLVPPSNPEKLKDAIYNIFKTDYKEMGENGYLLSKIEFDWDKICEKWDELYRQILTE